MLIAGLGQVQVEEGGVKLKNFSVSARLVNEKPAADASEKG